MRLEFRDSTRAAQCGGGGTQNTGDTTAYGTLHTQFAERHIYAKNKKQPNTHNLRLMNRFE